MIINNKQPLLQNRRYLRKNMTKEELILWSVIKNRKLLGFKFRRQHSVGNYILDFYCPERKLAIELDGNQHYDKDSIEYDNYRDEFCKSIGIYTLRFSNFEIRRNLNVVLLKITDTLEESTTPNPLLTKEGK